MAICQPDGSGPEKILGLRNRSSDVPIQRVKLRSCALPPTLFSFIEVFGRRPSTAASGSLWRVGLVTSKEVLWLR